MTHPKPTVGIYTLGCKVNQYESEAIAEQLEASGFSLFPVQERCDIYIINTCTVTAESDRKARQIIRRAHHKNPGARILVTGCFSQTSPNAVASIPGVDYVCGNADKLSVVRAAIRLLGEEKKPLTLPISLPPPDAFGFEEMRIARFDRTRAYIKIEDGCESHCSYCIIPSARGGIRSKAPEAVIAEAEALVAGGCRELVLTGIETASYGKDLRNTDLASLLLAVDRIPGLARVRLGSLDPSLIKQPFVDRIASLQHLAPHFHLSLQSGSDRILARMRRKYNRQMALDGIRRLRDAIPDVQFTTDVIVGFPGETDEDFQETLRFAEEARFLMIHIFPYSPRAGTPAAEMPDQIPEPIKHERLLALNAKEREIRGEILDRHCNTILPVLFETFEHGFVTGHTPQFLTVRVAHSRPLTGETRSVRLTGHDGDTCTGVFV